MAEQRRYNADQVRRVQESGEAAPQGMSNLGRFMRNAAVAVPRGLTDIVAASGMAVPAIKAGLSSEVDFAEALYGKEGIQELQRYVETETESRFNSLPVERRTQRNYNAIQDAVRNSSGAQEIMLRHGPVSTKIGIKAGDILNGIVGLNPVRKETIADDVSQIIVTALVPSGLITKPLAKIATKSAMAAAAKLTADVIVPGTAKYAVPNIATNIAVPLAVSQTLRAATDQPSMYTGDALAADSGVNAAYDPDPDDDDAGLGGEQLAGAAAISGGLATAAAVLMGKGNKVASKQIVDPIELPKLNIDLEDELQPGLSMPQKVGAAFDDSAPLRDYLSNGYGGPRSEDFKKNIGDIERVINDTASVNHGQMRDALLQRGELDGLDRKSVPVSHIYALRQKLPPPQQEAWDAYIIAMDDLDNYGLKLNSAKEAEQLAAAGVKTRGAPDTIAKHRAIKKQVEQLDDENFALDSGMTVKQAKELDARMKADPVMSQLSAMHRQVYNDMLDAATNKGWFTKEAADKMRTSRPNFMHKQTDDMAGMSHGMKVLHSFREKLRAVDRPKLYGGISGPIRTRAGMGSGEKVKNPLKPMEALQSYIHDHVDFNVRNEAKRAWTTAMRGTKDWGKTVREVHSMPVDQFYKEGLPDKIKKMKLTEAYFDKGTVHVIQVADQLTHRALQFHRPQTAGLGFNLMRKMPQQGTTGWGAPEFAPTSASLDHQIIGVTRQKGRSYGMIDQTLRKAFPDNKLLAAVLNNTNMDPTRHLQLVSGAFQGIKYNSLQAIGSKIAYDLRSSSGLFSLIGKQGGVLERAGEAMVRSLNATRYGQAVRARALDAHLLDDPLEDVRPKFEAVNHVITGPAKGLFHAYLGMLDAIHNSSKYAFFAQNLALLEHKYKGKVPEAELKKLASETRRSSGDMTRSPGSLHLSKIASATPYANIAINSAIHLGQRIRRDPVNVGLRILTGAVVPKLAAIGLIMQVPELNDWYWNELTPWQRLSTIPVIGPDWWIDLAKGVQRPVRKSDIYLMRETPEIALISNQMVTGLRAMGFFGPESEINVNYTKEFFKGMEGMTSLGVPPVLKALLGGGQIELNKIPQSMLTGEPIVQEGYTEDPQQYGNPTGINVDSDIPRWFANSIGAMFGVATQNMLNSYDVGVQEYDKSGNISQAFSEAFQFDVMQRERRLLEIPGTRETGATLFTDGYRRQYAGTARRLRVTEALTRFSKVKSQLSAERDSHGAGNVMKKQGLEGFATIADPKVKQLAQEMNQYLGRDWMLTLGKDRSALGAEMVLIDANKENMSPRSYHLRSVALRQRVDDIDKQMEDIVLNFEARLAQRYGPDIDLNAAIDIIEKSLSR